MATMTRGQHDEAAQHLVAARRAKRPGPRLPESCRPADVDDGLEIQRRVQRLLGLETGGWKCSLPTVERPVACAAIFAPTILRESPCRVLTHGSILRIEPEIAFVLGRDLPPRAALYTEAEVRSAIAQTRLVLELLGSRYEEAALATFPELLADQVSNQGLYVGPALRDALFRPLEGFPISIEGPTGTLHRGDGRHPDGHPLRPLVWLANFLASRASLGGLSAGQIVTTGSYAGALEVPVASPLSVHFGDLGSLAVEFVAS